MPALANFCAGMLLLLIAGSAPAQAQAAAAPTATGLDRLNWLAGCWSGSNGKFEFREHWMRAGGGVMLGMGRTLVNGRLASFESMRITLDASSTPVFTAKPSGKPEASFRMIRRHDDSVVFENLEKDFPQRVLYRLDPQGDLHARIEGVANGTERGIDFPMRRAACD